MPGNAQSCIAGGCGCNHPHPTHFLWKNARLTSRTDVSALPDIPIHKCDPYYIVKTDASTKMRREIGFDPIHSRSLTEALISILSQVNSNTLYVTILVLKCPTARLNHSVACWGTLDHGANVLEIPSHYSSEVLNRVFSSNGIAYPNGQSFLGLNTRRLCRTVPNSDPKLAGIHCEGWTPEEAEYTVRVLKPFISISVLVDMQVPLLFIGLGGDAACAPFFDELKTLLCMMCRGVTDEDQRMYRQNVWIIEGGTHFSNYVCWRFRYRKSIKQVRYV